MGEVWLAQDEQLSEPVALKFLSREISADAGALDELRRETARSHRLTHPNIVRLYDFHELEAEPAFIAMEFVDGPTLAVLGLRHEAHALNWEFLKPLVRQLCDALQYAHAQKVIHRDLKPANLMVDGNGRLKLADFGIAMAESDSTGQVSQPPVTSGTLPYMSPQQIAGRRSQPADDIYALGATLYELLTGQPPFHTGDITHQVLHEAPEPLNERLAALGIQNPVPADVAAMILACLAKEPGQRPPSAAAVAAWIAFEAADDEPTARTEPSAPRTGRAECRRKIRALFWPATTVLAVSLLAAALWTYWPKGSVQAGRESASKPSDISVQATEAIPPPPAKYFSDYANLIPRETARQLNQSLVDFEKATSSQILVAIFPKMQSDSPIEDYTARVFNSWGPGRKDSKNGAILFVFLQDHQISIQIGYGLEEVLSNNSCKRIIDNEIAPRFKQGDYGAGLSAGVSAMIAAAAKAGYKGTGMTGKQRM